MTSVAFSSVLQHIKLDEKVNSTQQLFNDLLRVYVQKSVQDLTVRSVFQNSRRMGDREGVRPDEVGPHSVSPTHLQRRPHLPLLLAREEKARRAASQTHLKAANVI